MTKCTTDSRNAGAQMSRPQGDEKYEFFVDVRGGVNYLLLIDREDMETSSVVEPIICLPLATEEQLASACKWVVERRNRWQSWGKIGAGSREALHALLGETLKSEPMDFATSGYLLQLDPKRRSLSVVRIVSDGYREGQVELWSETYGSTKKFERARRWFAANMQCLDLFDALLRERGREGIDAALAQNRNLARAA